MFLSRQKELALFSDLYASDRFEFLVLYGRRRVGKTTLLREFSNSKNRIFFSAQEKNDALNLSDFSEIIQSHFDHQHFGAFENWEKAFDYVTNRIGDERLLLIIDEFPFLALENPSIKSILQHTIDHAWKNKNLFLVLCGSSISFMEKEVMGYNSPLYGRATAQLEVLPFDYIDAANFFPDYSSQEKLMAYGILGGIPTYLENFDPRKNIRENLSSRILRTGSYLQDEPQVLLRMELREPAVYNSIFEAVACGASRMNDIATRIHEESQKCSKYLSTLRTLKLLEKINPVGESENSKKTLYRIKDPYFQFWFRFLFREKSYLDIIGPEKAADEILEPERFAGYMGDIFEQICTQYLIRRAKDGALPFVPHDIGKWWGNNPYTKKQDDIDILLLDKSQTSGIFCECKYRNSPFDKPEYEDLLNASKVFSHVPNRYYYLFSKSGFTPWVKEQASRDDRICLIGPDDLFQTD